MNDRVESITEKNMNNKLEHLDPASERFQVLNAAKKFKSNWLDLGELLNECLKKNDFRKWGFDNFDAYLKSELRIKPETAMKLIASFGYLKKHRPSITSASDVLKPIPDFKVINKLQNAVDSYDFSKKEIEELQESVFEKGISPAKLNKAIKTMTQEVNDDNSSENHEKKLIDKMQQALETIKKIMPVFEPDARIITSLHEVETFLAQIME